MDKLERTFIWLFYTWGRSLEDIYIMAGDELKEWMLKTGKINEKMIREWDIKNIIE
jgi:hypothetical protein